jgi:hypothetical protein
MEMDTWRYNGVGESGKIIKVLRKNIHFYGLLKVYKGEHDTDQKFAAGICLLQTVISEEVFLTITMEQETSSHQQGY